MFNIVLLFLLLSIAIGSLPASDDQPHVATVDVLAAPVNSQDSEMVDVAPGLPLMAPVGGINGLSGPMGGL